MLFDCQLPNADCRFIKPGKRENWQLAIGNWQ